MLLLRRKNMTKPVKSLVFFKPKPPGFQIHRKEHPDDFDRLVFVLKARLNKGASHPFTSVLHVERTGTGSRLVASDGKRMHAAVIGIKIKSGNYRPSVTKDTVSFGEPAEGVAFPAWHKAIPAHAQKRGTVSLRDTGMGKDKARTAALTRAFKTFVAASGELINLGYLEDLPKTEWDIYKEPGTLKTVMLKQRDAREDAIAVILPMTAAA
jgi:hypothetical protein